MKHQRLTDKKVKFEVEHEGKKTMVTRTEAGTSRINCIVDPAHPIMPGDHLLYLKKEYKVLEAGEVRVALGIYEDNGFLPHWQQCIVTFFKYTD